jgi:hypothetical protein
MDHPPFFAQGADRRRQRVLDPVQIGRPEPVTFAQRRRTSGAMQIEYRLAIRARYMNMCRSMVVRPYHDA